MACSLYLAVYEDYEIVSVVTLTVNSEGVRYFCNIWRRRIDALNLVKAFSHFKIKLFLKC